MRVTVQVYSKAADCSIMESVKNRIYTREDSMDYFESPPPNRRHVFRDAKYARQTFRDGGTPAPRACAGLFYKKAAIDDLDILTETRIEVLRAANKLSDDMDMSEVKEQTYAYYEKALRDGTHIAYLVFDGKRFAGAGGVSFFQVMPTYHNPSGYKAYIMNMYTRPEYRRKGIAFRTLDLLVEESRKRGIESISLEATEMGRPLYEKYGFTKMNDEMELLPSFYAISPAND